MCLECSSCIIFSFELFFGLEEFLKRNIDFLSYFVKACQDILYASNMFSSA